MPKIYDKILTFFYKKKDRNALKKEVENYRKKINLIETNFEKLKDKIIALSS